MSSRGSFEAKGRGGTESGVSIQFRREAGGYQAVSMRTWDSLKDDGANREGGSAEKSVSELGRPRSSPWVR